MLTRIAIPTLILLLAGACTVSHSRTGDANRWRDETRFVEGQTTAQEVLDELGPPTQIYDFGKRTAFFYQMLEERREGFNLILWKRTDREFYSDRAVFFFTEDGVLEEMGVSLIALPSEAEYQADPWQEVKLTPAEAFR